MIDDPVVRVQVLPDRSHVRCVQRQVPVVQTADKLRIPAVAVLQGRRQFPVVVQRPIPMVCDHRVSPFARRYGGRCPNLQVVQISLSWRRGLSHGADCSSDHRDLHLLLDKVVDAPVMLVVRVPGHLHPCRGAEACSHGPDCSSGHEIPQLLDMVIDVPVVLVVQDISVVVQRPISMVSLIMEIPQLLFDVVVMSLV